MMAMFSSRKPKAPWQPRSRVAHLARGAAKSCAKRSAEMRRVTEAPGECDFAHAARGARGVAQVATGGVQALGPDPIAYRARLAGPGSVQRARREPQCLRNLRHAEIGVGQPRSHQRLDLL